jgi:hypothetical protein|tara:strand:- start:147 stop:410 length:264 start_codon:yes stop_codon:yes gene_type:complete
MNIQDVLHAIHIMDKPDAERVREAADMRRTYLSKAAISVGTAVKFNAGKRGWISGTVQKINPTRTKVQTPVGIWNVSHSLLELELAS